MVDREDMTEKPPPDESTSSDELLERLQSTDPTEAADVAESLADSLAADLATTETLPRGETGDAS